MKTLFDKIYLLTLLIVLGLSVASCDDNTSDMQFDGDTDFVSFKLGEYEATIDNVAKTLFVGLPVDCDASSLTVSQIELSAGATADVTVGEVLNCTVPHTFTVRNGDVYSKYTLTVKHDDVQVLTAMLGSTYQGSIDNSARTIQFFVPLDEDVTSMALYYTLSEGGEGNPTSGSVLDFTDPVSLTVAYRTATITYTVTVIKDEMSQEPKAFIGNADDVNSLNDEAKAAAQWMISNVPNVTFVSLNSILNGTVKLSSFKMIWCHLDWTDWPSIMWDTRDLFNDYYIKGGNILASRDGARYINDVWRIAKDQQSPNNTFGGDSYETLTYDLGFSIKGHESHALYDGIATDAEGRILLLATGCANSNRTLQWGADWDPYGSMEGWEERTGAVALASGHNYDINRVTIAEFAPREVLNGYQSGTVITIGTPAYEWYDPNGASNQYRDNLVKLTKNAINYLCK